MSCVVCRSEHHACSYLDTPTGPQIPGILSVIDFLYVGFRHPDLQQWEDPVRATDFILSWPVGQPPAGTMVGAPVPGGPRVIVEEDARGEMPSAVPAAVDEDGEDAFAMEVEPSGGTASAGPRTATMTARAVRGRPAPVGAPSRVRVALLLSCSWLMCLVVGDAIQLAETQSFAVNCHAQGS